MQAQHAARRFQVHVIMGTARALLLIKIQTARHAQVHQQKALVQINEQVFTAAAHLGHLTSDQLRGFQPQRPAQGLAHMQGQHPGTGNTVGKALACDFNFGQFGHK